jgi:type IV pilus assembly protein PilM
VAARADDAAGLLVATERVNLAEGALVPGLKPGNVVDRATVVAAVRAALEGASGRGTGSGGARKRDVTLIVPDAAVRVLLLDFDSLPGKQVEALPVVRFRLKKLLPFDAEDAVVSYQVMASGKDGLKLVAVAIPREVLAEYEGVVAGAGYLAGAVLPSTLAALAGLTESDVPLLTVNAGISSVTTAIVKGGVLLLHRSVDMTTTSVNMRSDLDGHSAVLPLVDRESSAEEWALQEPVGYDRMDAETAMQTSVLERAELREQATNATLVEVAQAVSVAAAYFEDTLGVTPEILLAAGTTPAEKLEQILMASGLEGLHVREMLETSMISVAAVTASVTRGWLAGVRGALTS